jgi:hypothetical protein
MPDLPILGQSGPSGPNGGASGASLASIDELYAVELTTADGKSHILSLRFDRPLDPHGNVDLGALRNFNPRLHATRGVIQKIASAWYAPLDRAALVEETEDGGLIVWRHVVSFRYLGELDIANAVTAVDGG